jgi:hypothetical protein
MTARKDKRAEVVAGVIIASPFEAEVKSVLPFAGLIIGDKKRLWDVRYTDHTIVLDGVKHFARRYTWALGGPTLRFEETQQIMEAWTKHMLGAKYDLMLTNMF